MFIPGKLGAIVGILLIWGGYALTTVICTTIADKVARWLNNRFLEGNYDKRRNRVRNRQVRK